MDEKNAMEKVELSNEDDSGYDHTQVSLLTSNQTQGKSTPRKPNFHADNTLVTVELDKIESLGDSSREIISHSVKGADNEPTESVKLPVKADRSTVNNEGAIVERENQLTGYKVHFRTPTRGFDTTSDTG